MTISANRFSCPFDSGKLGYMWATHEEIKQWYQVQEITPDILQKVQVNFIEQIEEYDRYMNGTFYGVTIEEKTYNATTNEVETNCIESCWGFSDTSDALEFAMECLDNAEAVQEIRKHIA
jgi:hypothetical protein